ncbi:NAD-dependent epimerase/dehydratase family protein [Levilactobacillus fujinensis]|uniref:NAD-dependent epimerase/dehydratase family protein n=1 Tax=Levilactobacillus fujinensis TaxID=2486024 RepID=A0ABW1TH58_9LACO|nr:NAD-dependent epimerase/dehydratase family protein [Levilactobacillus fujinensis]
MTTNIVLLGGSGYIGRELVKAWRSRDADTEFWLLSRSGATRLDLSDVHGVAVDLLRPQLADDALPARIDYIVDLVGGPKDDPQELADFNRLPAQLMQRLADQYQPTAMGFIGGKLGPKAFVAIKKDLIQELQSSVTPLAFVEPTLVYGAGRKDQMTRFVPLLRVLGVIVPNLRPVKVDTVVTSLLNELLAK